MKLVTLLVRFEPSMRGLRSSSGASDLAVDAGYSMVEILATPSAAAALVRLGSVNSFSVVAGSLLRTCTFILSSLSAH